MDIIFSKQFKEPIQQGSKIQTIRKRIRCNVGDKVNCVINPYNSQREIIRPVIIYSITPINLDATKKNITIGGRTLNREGIKHFCHNEGFLSVDTFWEYITKQNCIGTVYLYRWGYFDYSRYFKPLLINFSHTH